MLGFGFRVSEFGFWVLAVGFWVLGLGFWVLGFRFWVWGFGFWVLSFGFWLHVLVGVSGDHETAEKEAGRHHEIARGEQEPVRESHLLA